MSSRLSGPTTGAVADPVSNASPTRGVPAEHAFLRGVVHGMRCGILSVDRAGKVVMLNEPAREALELEPIVAIGRPVADVLHEHPHLAQTLLDSFTMSSLPNRAEIEIRLPDGGIRTLGFTVSMVPDAEGDPIGASMFFKDLTQVEQREEQERLRDRLAALGQMSASLAHEIRNPLASIEVTCSLLKRRMNGESDDRDLVDKIISEVRRLNRTISSSLEFVRPLSLSLGVHRLAPVLDEALAVARSRSGGEGIEIRCTVDPAMPPFRFDRGQLRQVFENLLLNAMEAMEQGGRLTIAAGAEPSPGHEPDPNDLAVVTIEDSGCGIADEHLDKLFYPFFTTKPQGSGVGLSMARKIVVSHGGVLDVASSDRRGSVFTVRLPMAGTPEDPHR